MARIVPPRITPNLSRDFPCPPKEVDAEYQILSRDFPIMKTYVDNRPQALLVRNNVLLPVPAVLYATNNYLKFTMQVSVPSMASVFNCEYALKSQYDTSIYLQSTYDRELKLHTVEAEVIKQQETKRGLSIKSEAQDKGIRADQQNAIENANYSLADELCHQIDPASLLHRSLLKLNHKPIGHSQFPSSTTCKASSTSSTFLIACYSHRPPKTLAVTNLPTSNESYSID
ncbi:hypothetical protein L2E82_13708 [Cichorium intybus]|uniref:Uncharacterized protein n=1 Tax=Cichorium intybus TaxID=13427 RepID=A0ACB9EXY8_CICIN|nr:hypothetical protein L2E82_13708 [Cichorium intybus]